MLHHILMLKIPILLNAESLFVWFDGDKVENL